MEKSGYEASCLARTTNDEIILAQMAFYLIAIIAKEIGIDFSGKKVIDVGCGSAYKTREIEALGADVYVCEPREAVFKWALEQVGHIKKGKAFNCLVQDLPESLFGTFDIVTVFKYRMVPNYLIFNDFKTDAIASEINNLQLQANKSLAKLLKPDGELIIEILNIPADQYLFYPEACCSPIVYALKRLFEEVEYVDTSYSESIFIRARKPFDKTTIDKVSISDICIKDPDSSDSVISAYGNILEEGCYYEGIHSPFYFALSEDKKRLRYIPKSKEQI